MSGPAQPTETGTDAGEPSPRLRFESIAGPPLAPVSFEPGEAVVIGRSTTADTQLADGTISRRHCRIEQRSERWFVSDLGSKHGTYLQGVRLRPEQPAPLSDGDLIRLGPWTFRVRDGITGRTSVATSNDLAASSHRVQRVPVRELRSVAQQRLDLLIDCAGKMNDAENLPQLAERVLDAVVEGTGFNRAAFIRQLSAAGEIEVLAKRTPDGGPDAGFTFSRSLITAASDGEIVRMTGDSGGYGESIVRLGIHSALCAPITLADSVEAYLYLDARETEDAVQADAAAFCQAISKLAGLALANLKRADLERHRTLLEGDLKAARQAQVVLMPPSIGTHGRYTYAMQTKPGRFVAGDLFDVIELDPGDPDGEVAVWLGDVSGEGVGAAMLMATAQTYLKVALRHSRDPGTVVSELNRHIAPRAAGSKFLTLWFGVMNPRDNTCRFTDGGHGHWLHAPVDQAPALVKCQGGLIVGVDEGFGYVTETIPMNAGDRLMLFSDGLVEQRRPDGDQFGTPRVIEALEAAKTPTRTCRDDVVAMVRAVRDYAETDALSDDLTVATVERVPV